jgi:hypothetical protein
MTSPTQAYAPSIPEEIPGFIVPFLKLTSEISSLSGIGLITQRTVSEVSEIPKELSIRIYRVSPTYLISFLITSIITIFCFISIYLSVKENIILIDPFYCIFGLIASIGLSITSLIGYFRKKQ